MSLPDRNSVAPADLMAYALIEWQPSQLVRCPTCKESCLAGYARSCLTFFVRHTDESTVSAWCLTVPNARPAAGHGFATIHSPAGLLD